MSKKVYALSRGQYSDYSIVAIFSSVEKLEEYKAAYPGDGMFNDYNPGYETYEIDPIALKMARKGYSVWTVMLYKDGSLVYEANDPVRKSGDPAYLTDQVFWSTHGYFKPKQEWAIFQVWAKDMKQAIKIANERRIMSLATPSS